MKERNQVLKALRPEIIRAKVDENTSVEEAFQNEVLRPIIKFQHDLLVALFKQYLKKRKIDFTNSSEQNKLAAIESIFKADTKFKTELKGIIIGLFSLEEYQSYIENNAGLNKRILTIIKERFLSNCHLF